MRFRSKNNSISEFNKISDIEDFLKRQWSALLQRLLFEQRSHKNEYMRIESFSEELKDIKSLVLSSISSTQAKEIGRGVLKYRRLIDFLLSFQHANIHELLTQNIDWDSILKSLDIREVKVININSRYRPLIFLIKTDDTFYEYRNPVVLLTRFANEWNSFRQLNNDVKTEIINVISESEQHGIMMLRHREENYEQYIQAFEERQSASTTATTTTISRTTLSEQADEDDNSYTSSTNDRT